MRIPTRTSAQTKRPIQPLQPLDKMARRVMLILIVVIAAMLLVGAQALPQVRTFSWQNKAVTADDVAFMLTFTQPVNPESVEENLQIKPELPGKFSWAGRRMAYTLAVPAPYGETFTISLPEATALNGKSGFEPFLSQFHTRDRAFAYIGSAGETKGRLVLFNLTHKEKTILTPEDQIVLDYRIYPERDRILYSSKSAIESKDKVASPELYTVSTGLAVSQSVPKWQFWRHQTQAPVAGELTRILDNKDYQNLKFDLSPNGKVIVVQRVNQQNPIDYGPWVIVEGEPPRKLKTEPGGDFKIAPDSASLLLQQGKGTAVIALASTSAAESSDELLDFLPDYGLTLDITNDGNAAALVNFNQDDPTKQFTQSLFWVSNQGEEKPLLQTDGAILSAQFNDNNEILYCLVTRLVEDEEYLAIPYLTAVNVKTGKSEKLLEMPPQPEITISLSPDGLAILFDEALTDDALTGAGSKETLSQPTHRLWLLPLFSTVEERLLAEPIPLPPTELEITGRQPAWLP